MKIATFGSAKAVAGKLRASLYYARKRRLERLKAQQEAAEEEAESGGG